MNQNRNGFVHHWVRGTTPSDEPCIRMVASNRFSRIGVGPGDDIYCVFVQSGKLHLVGRLRVRELVPASTVPELPSGYRWREVCLGQGTRIRYDRVVPDEVVASLRKGRDLSAPVFNESGWLDGQTFRTDQQLDASSAKLLEDLIISDED